MYSCSACDKHDAHLPLCQTGNRSGSRLPVYVDSIDTRDQDVMREIDIPHTVASDIGDLSNCTAPSYGPRAELRRSGNESCPNDSKFQIADSKLQTGDSKLQIGDSWLRIGDFTFPPAGLEHRLDVTELRMGDLSVKRPRRGSISTLRSFKLAIRSFKSAIRSVPQRHYSFESRSRSVIRSAANS